MNLSDAVILIHKEPPTLEQLNVQVIVLCETIETMAQRLEQMSQQIDRLESILTPVDDQQHQEHHQQRDPVE